MHIQKRYNLQRYQETFLVYTKILYYTVPESAGAGKQYTFSSDICTYTKSVQGLRLHTHTSHKQQEAQNSHTIRLAGKTGEVPMCVDVDIEVEQNSLTSGPERGRQANEHRFNMSTRIHDIKE